MDYLIGLNTFWLDLHLFIAFLLVGSSMMVLGGIYLSSRADERIVRLLKRLSLLSLVLVVVLLITGILPDIYFGLGDTFSFTATNDFGNFSATVSDQGLSLFTGPLLFDIMEHITLIGPAITSVVALLIWHYGSLVVTDPRIKRSVLILGLTGISWLFVLMWIGMYLSRILTFPFTG